MIDLTDPGQLFLLLATGAAGAVARVWISERHPAGTLVVNVAGSLAAGGLLGWSLTQPSATLFALLSLGLLGAFTTFSTWMVEVVDAFQGTGGEGGPALPQALRRAILPVVLGVGAAALGVTTGVVLGEGLVAVPLS
ncbi:MAG: CrcB family protein [Gemmatimonadales bacterium]|nr:MAG: CrcB family protein [Gemmatimonadales bacterium]